MMMEKSWVMMKDWTDKDCDAEKDILRLLCMIRLVQLNLLSTQSPGKRQRHRQQPRPYASGVGVGHELNQGQGQGTDKSPLLDRLCASLIIADYCCWYRSRHMP